MKTLRYFIFILIVIVSLNACKKTEGEGGTATIKGKVLVKEYNYNFTELIREYYAQGEDVYIVYGDEAQVGDRVETYHDGSYQFNFMRKGDYTIYVYSEDNTGESLSGDIPVEKDVQILSKGETVEVEDIVIYNATNNNGTATITGKVYVLDYNALGNPTGNDYYAYDEDVFLMRDGDTYIYDDCKTHYDGTYRFEKLPVGKYKVYSYSKTYSGGVQQQDEPVIVEVTITNEFQTVTAAEIQIKK